MKRVMYLFEKVYVSLWESRCILHSTSDTKLCTSFIDLSSEWIVTDPLQKKFIMEPYLSLTLNEISFNCQLTTAPGTRLDGTVPLNLFSIRNQSGARPSYDSLPSEQLSMKKFCYTTHLQVSYNLTLFDFMSEAY